MDFDAGQRRRYKRYPVKWGALLVIDTDDFSDYMRVPVVNISREGALIQSGGISIHHRHLAAASLCGELNLVMETPGGEMDSEIRIKHFNWSEEKKQFDIGARFVNMSEKNLTIMGRAIERVDPPPHGEMSDTGIELTPGLRRQYD